MSEDICFLPIIDLSIISEKTQKFTISAEKLAGKKEATERGVKERE